jgi:hypothetical protein
MLHLQACDHEFFYYALVSYLYVQESYVTRLEMSFEFSSWPAKSEDISPLFYTALLQNELKKEKG